MAAQITRFGMFKEIDVGNALAIAGLMGIFAILIVPLQTSLLSLLIVINMSIALVILMMTFYVRRALDFSTFPTVILILTLFRLSLNLATTKIILSRAETGEVLNKAGAVIRFFGEFVAANDPVVGFVVFLILTLIMFIVITRGAGRIAEVAARFTLDAMPGKQLSIDQDLNAGLINEDEARARRVDIAREADFYGAMDGASKFVRGDAIAGLVITAVNVLGGLLVGVLRENLTVTQTLHTYTMLTIGDGLASQIPALLMSTAAGIVVTRAASTDTLGRSVGLQVLAQPFALFFGGVSLLLIGLIAMFWPDTRGISMPFMSIGVLLVGTTFYLWEQKVRLGQQEADQAAKEARVQKEPERIEDLLRVDPMELEIGYALVPIMDPQRGGDFLERVAGIRRSVALELGVIVPQIRIRDNMNLSPNHYTVSIKGIRVTEGELRSDHYMVLNPGGTIEGLSGWTTTEPAFGLPAMWVPPEQKGLAESSGYQVFESSAVLATHLSEVIRGHAGDLLGRQEVEHLIDTIKPTAGVVCHELLEGPNKIGVAKIQKVLQNLLRERVSIRNLAGILEAIADNLGLTQDTDLLTECARISQARMITQQYLREDNRLPVIMLEPSVEKVVTDAVRQSNQGAYMAMDPQIQQEIIRALSGAVTHLSSQLGQAPPVLTNPQIRLFFKRMIERSVPGVAVLSYNEISPDVEIRSVGVVQIAPGRVKV